MAKRQTAMGMETWATSTLASASEIPGKALPRRIPTVMQRATQTERYFSQRPSPLFAAIQICSQIDI